MILISAPEWYSCYYVSAGVFTLGDSNCKSVDELKTPRISCPANHCAVSISSIMGGSLYLEVWVSASILCST